MAGGLLLPDYITLLLAVVGSGRQIVNAPRDFVCRPYLRYSYLTSIWHRPHMSMYELYACMLRLSRSCSGPMTRVKVFRCSVST